MMADRMLRIEGERTEEGLNLYLNGKIVKHQVRHSPTGMECGYCGSGPADAARSILLMFLPEEEADKLYQRFKFDFVAGWPSQKKLEVEINFDEWLRRKV